MQGFAEDTDEHADGEKRNTRTANPLDHFVRTVIIGHSLRHRSAKDVSTLAPGANSWR